MMRHVLIQITAIVKLEFQGKCKGFKMSSPTETRGRSLSSNVKEEMYFTHLIHVNMHQDLGREKI